MTEPDREYRAFEARVRRVVRENCEPRFVETGYAASTLAAAAALLVLTTVGWVAGRHGADDLRAWDLPDAGIAGSVELALVLVVIAGSFGLARARVSSPRPYRVMASVAVLAVIVLVAIVVADIDLDATFGMGMSLVVMLVLAGEHAMRAAALAGSRS